MNMKHLATMALMLNLAVAGLNAQQRSVNMTFSGSGGASAIDLKQPNTSTGEENVAGNGTLGPFTFQLVRAARDFSATIQHLLGRFFPECGRRGPTSLPGR